MPLKCVISVFQWEPEKPAYQLAVVPWQGPFHISFNAQQNVITIYRFFFEPLYRAIFGNRKVLAKKPKPYRISTLITATFGGWLLVRDVVLNQFGTAYKNTEFVVLQHVLEEIVPLVFFFYPVVFWGGNYDEYQSALCRAAVMFIIHCRRHYDKATLCQISDMAYHETNVPTISLVERTILSSLTEKKVETFHSLLRRYMYIGKNCFVKKKFLQI